MLFFLQHFASSFQFIIQEKSSHSSLSLHELTYFQLPSNLLISLQIFLFHDKPKD